MKSKIILIGGGSASGKTLLATHLKEKLKDVLLIAFDNYCKPHPELSKEERELINYDHPDSYDHKELINDLTNIMNNDSYSLPTYDFATHLRKAERQKVKKCKYIIIDGIFSLYYKDLLPLADFKIFCLANEDVRLSRRINRDIKERGRSKESVLMQWEATVKPMHYLYIEPTKTNADYILLNNENNGLNETIVNDIINRIN